MQNKTASAVQLKHLPTGLVVKSQATRSREQNRKIARNILALKLEERFRGDDSRTAKLREKASKKKASKTKKAKRKYYQPLKLNLNRLSFLCSEVDCRYTKLAVEKAIAVSGQVSHDESVNHGSPDVGLESNLELVEQLDETAEMTTVLKGTLYKTPGTGL